MQTIIKKATLKDYDEISKLVKEIHDLHVKNRPDFFRDVDNPFLKEEFESLIIDSTISFLIVEDIITYTICGYAIIKLMQTPVLPIVVQKSFIYIEDFCILKEYKRQGLGKLLFNHIVDYAKTKKAASL